MPIAGVVQPETIEVGEGLRLRRYDGKHDFALAWYEDRETVRLVDGVRTPYTPERLARMYAVLQQKGELYFIEARENGAFRPIGDVAFRQGDMPIVIGEASYRGRGIGARVVAALVARGRQLGYRELFVREIFEFNAASRRLFERAGFREYQKTENGHSFRIEL